MHITDNGNMVVENWDQNYETIRRYRTKKRIRSVMISNAKHIIKKQNNKIFFNKYIENLLCSILIAPIWMYQVNEWWQISTYTCKNQSGFKSRLTIKWSRVNRGVGTCRIDWISLDLEKGSLDCTVVGFSHPRKMLLFVQQYIKFSFKFSSKRI